MRLISRTSSGKLHGEREPKLALRRHLPEDVVAIAARFAQLEVGGTEDIGDRGQGAEEGGEQESTAAASAAAARRSSRGRLRLDLHGVLGAQVLVQRFLRGLGARLHQVARDLGP